MESDNRSDQQKRDAATQSGIGEAGTSLFVSGYGSSPPVGGLLLPPIGDSPPQGEQSPQCARHTPYCRNPDQSGLPPQFRLFKKD